MLMDARMMYNKMEWGVVIVVEVKIRVVVMVVVDMIV